MLQAEMGKMIVYQLFVRLFGNKNTGSVLNGSIEENGCGKFNDISSRALGELKRLGITHVWYTGIIEHATMTDYSAYGISPDNPFVVKGRAGSPYAVRDCYDVDPDLASSADRRMLEFDGLVERTHSAGLKVIIDFVPNHVARNCKSDVKPGNVRDLGEEDNTDVFFDRNNNFYYIPGKEFAVPPEYIPASGARRDVCNYVEYPAKASGNDVFSASPGINDWFETVKLNYGIDFLSGTAHFDPVPDTWLKMLDILLFWAEKGVDGFRCDMCEMVPAEFWSHAVGEVKKLHPHVVFIGEAYSPANYKRYVSSGFDYLYDKSGLYDLLRAAITGHSGLDRLQDYLHSEIRGLEGNMLSFLENHDEQRFASPQFAGSPDRAVPLMTLAATLHPSPVMIYFGQEVGAKAAGATGFSGDDGRTSIFDYTHVPEIQQWMNGGSFDGGLLSREQAELRSFYAKLLNICNSEEAISDGRFGNLFESNANGKSQGFNQYMNCAFARYTENSRLIIFVTIDSIAPDLYLKLPADLLADMGLDRDSNLIIEDILFTDCKTVIRGEDLVSTGIHFTGKAMSAAILRIFPSEIPLYSKNHGILFHPLIKHAPAE
ncbi:MAG: alpha-amylase family protein [Prevotellaceae bacterium]|jgi:glycosidase|nr:alpha-amylase family protein [Prevotellaceae bacterium]